MRFEWMNQQGVTSDAGYVLQRMHRFYYHYIEGEHVLKVDVESSLKGEEIFFDSKRSWEVPHEDEQIADEKLAEIESRVGAALKFMGIRYEIQRL